MKLSFMGLCALALVGFFACQKSGINENTNTNELGLAAKKAPINSGSCAGYNMTLDVDKTTIPGKTIFTWKIVNTQPGNGTTSSTTQSLSHWDFIPSACLDQNWQDLYQASYRMGESGDFTPIYANYLGQNISPIIQPDPSLKTATGFNADVFKFDFGTNGSQPTYYRIVMSGNWGTDAMSGYYKSGSNTGYCDFTSLGIGCPITETLCSYSQGYWFANNSAHTDGVHPWNSDVTIGGATYTNAEGLAIWNAENKGGIRDAKKAFTQLAAIRLSTGGIDPTGDPALTSAITTIDKWFTTIGKLNTALTANGKDFVNLPNQTAGEVATFGDAKAAAGYISSWIAANHCQ